MTANDPTSTPSSSIAPRSIAAAECTIISVMDRLSVLLGAGGLLPRIDDHRADLGFCNNLAVDLRLPFETPDTPAIAPFGHVIVHRIAGQNRAAETRAIDRHEVNELRLVGLGEVSDAERARGLRHPFDQEHARHDR